jgi:hypothetical protein
MNISLENWLRNKLQENEEMHDYAVATETVRCWIDDYKQLSQHDVSGEYCPICKSDDLVDIDDHYTESVFHVRAAKNCSVPPVIKSVCECGSTKFNITNKPFCFLCGKDARQTVL